MSPLYTFPLTFGIGLMLPTAVGATKNHVAGSIGAVLAVIGVIALIVGRQ